MAASFAFGSLACECRSLSPLRTLLPRTGARMDARTEEAEDTGTRRAAVGESAGETDREGEWAEDPTGISKKNTVHARVCVERGHRVRVAVWWWR